VLSQSKLFAEYFPYKETKISLFEAVYGNARNEIVAHGDSEAYSSPKAPSNILNDKKFSCVKSNLAIFNVDYVMSYPIYFK